MTKIKLYVKVLAGIIADTIAYESVSLKLDCWNFIGRELLVLFYTTSVKSIDI